MASRRSRTHHHPPRPLDVDTLRRRNKALIFIVLVLFAFLLVYNRRNERRVELATHEARVQEAFLEIGGALDRYRTDCGTYPVELPGIYSASGIARLTTPQPYLWDPEVTLDPFTQASLRVAILDTTPARWLLISAGPNRQWELLELPRGAEAALPHSTDQEPLKVDGVGQFIARFQYDPTNGSLSKGDILLLGK